MSEESRQPDIDPKLDDTKLEARMVALCLGEASDFERDELEQLIAQRPDLQAVQQEIQQLHDALQVVGQGEQTPPDADWKLPKDKRETVIAAFEGKPNAKTMEERIVINDRLSRQGIRKSLGKGIRKGIRFWPIDIRRPAIWKFAKIAAVFGGISLVGGWLLFPTIQSSRFARVASSAAKSPMQRQLSARAEASRPASMGLKQEAFMYMEESAPQRPSAAAEDAFGTVTGPANARKEPYTVNTPSNSAALAELDFNVSSSPNQSGADGEPAPAEGVVAESDESQSSDRKDSYGHYGTRWRRSSGAEKFEGLRLGNEQAANEGQAGANSRLRIATEGDEAGAAFELRDQTQKFVENEKEMQQGQIQRGGYGGGGGGYGGAYQGGDDDGSPMDGGGGMGGMGGGMGSMNGGMGSGMGGGMMGNGGRDYSGNGQENNGQQTDDLYAVDQPHMPATDDAPIYYPDSEEWGQISERRKRFEGEILGFRVRTQNEVAKDRVFLDETEELDINADVAGITDNSNRIDSRQPSKNKRPASKPDRFGNGRGLGVGHSRGEGPEEIADSNFYDSKMKADKSKGKMILSGSAAPPAKNDSAGAKLLEMPVVDGFNGPMNIDNLWTDTLTMPANEKTDRNVDTPVTAMPIDAGLAATAPRRAVQQKGVVNRFSKEFQSATGGWGGRIEKASPGAESYSFFLSNTEAKVSYLEHGLNEKSAIEEAFSTFSLHVGDVSFKLARAALAKGQWPDATKIRIEEFVNAFDYGDPLPCHGERVACSVEQSIHPFLQQRNMLRVSMRTAATGRSASTPLRLTLLLDNSGSMERFDRQQTVRRAFSLLAQQLKPIDQVTLISFARKPRLLADKVSGAQAQELVKRIENLPSEGGTNIEKALQLAFEKAKEQRVEGAQNRIILLTDGAVNLGNADPEGLSKMIASMREQGIAFDAAGISAEGLNDEVLEALTRKGDGRYYLLDSAESADDGFAKQIAGALRPSAKNVKVQVEFNPDRVGNYKLLGFEKHRLKKEDFRNDKVDAAEMAAAEAGVAVYQFEAKPNGEGDVGSVSVRFRDLATGQMVENRWPIPYEPDAPRLDQAAPSLRVATSAALLAAKLRGEPLGKAVELPALTKLLGSLPPETRSAKRVQQLEQMIQQVRQIQP